MIGKRMLGLSGLLSVVVLAAVPASALGAPLFDFSTANSTFAGTFGEATLTSLGQEEITCTGSNHVSGSWTTSVVNGKNAGTTGHIVMTFTNCHPRNTPGVACTTSGQAAGTVVMGTSEFHLVYGPSIPTRTPVILITPPTGGIFAKFSCSFLVNIEVLGNGVIGEIRSPGCGSTSEFATVRFDTLGTASQTWQEIEGGGGTKYHLTEKLNGGTAKEAALDALFIQTLGGFAQGTLTCN